MKKLILITLSLCFTLSVTFSQVLSDKSVKQNSVYLDLGGYAFWYSLNYEHKVPLAKNQRLSLGGGVSVIPLTIDANILIGASANYLYGNEHNIEIGFSPAYNLTGNEFLFSHRIGYRYEAPTGFLFRIGISPVYGDFFTNRANDNKKEMIPWGYISVGYSF